eukprot:NODE_166_length_16344_cov_0.418775.p1 type:complete len:483 gc:universal NODE_166_length_16344_cov_0.418775:15668-14220(-)
MDPLYVLKLKCCYLEELLEDKFSADQCDLLKEIADLKSRLKTNGLKEIKSELSEFIPFVEDDSNWLQILKDSLCASAIEPKNVDDLTDQISESLKNEITDYRLYISELENVNNQNIARINELEAENNTLKFVNPKSVADQQSFNTTITDPPSPLLNKGADMSLLQDMSMLKSPVINPVHSDLSNIPDLNINELLQTLVDVLCKSSPIDSIQMYAQEYPIINEIINIFDDLESQLTATIAIKQQASTSLSDLKNDISKDNSEFLALQNKVNKWKVLVMQAMNEKEQTITQLLADIDMLKQEKLSSMRQIEEIKIADQENIQDDDLPNIPEMLLKLEKDSSMLNIENERLRKANDQMNSRFKNVVENAQKLKLQMDRYEQESTELQEQLDKVLEEKEQLSNTFEQLKEKMQLRITDSINDDNIVEKYEMMIYETEKFMNELENRNVQLQDELDIAVGQTEAERIRATKMNELLQQKNQIDQVSK